MIALGDVAGKGSPAALLMALLLAMLRTLVDEGLGRPTSLHAPERAGLRGTRRARASSRCSSRSFDPVTGELTYVNAGQTRRSCGGHGAMRAADSTAASRSACSSTRPTPPGDTSLEPGDVLVMYSDGITEAENPQGMPSTRPASKP